MSKKLLMALVGIVGAAALIAVPAPASATEEEQGRWKMPHLDDPCFDPCPSQLPICKCYEAPPIIVH